MRGLGKEIQIDVYTVTPPVGNWGDPVKTLAFSFTGYKQPFTGDGNYRNDQYFENVRDFIVCYDTSIALTKGQDITYEGRNHRVEYVQFFESSVVLPHVEIYTSDTQ